MDKEMTNDVDLENEIEEEIEREAYEQAVESEVEEKSADSEAEENAAKETEPDTAEPEKEPEDKTAKELAEHKDKLLRLMAEYDNYRKRTAKEQLETRQTAVGDTVLEFIKIFDNFERAAETECSDEKYKEGVEMILKQFRDALEKLHVKIIDPTGEPFDPATANAVSQIEDPELGENVVAQVFEKGVMIGDRVIRYPMVVVANP